LIWLTGGSGRRRTGQYARLALRLPGILLKWIIGLTTGLVGGERIVGLSRIRILGWRRDRIPRLSGILDRLTRILWLTRVLWLTWILWLPRILWLNWLAGILRLPRILRLDWLSRILGLYGWIGLLTRELLELRRVLRLLSGVLLGLPHDRWILGLTCLTRERRWHRLTGILNRLARQLSRILELARILRLLAPLRLHPGKIHLLGLRGILGLGLPWLNHLPWIGRSGCTGISGLHRISGLYRISRLWRITWLCLIPRLAWRKHLPRLSGILRILLLRILGLRVGVALGDRLFRPGARNTVARSPQGHVQSRVNGLAILVRGGLRTGWNSRRLSGCRGGSPGLSRTRVLRGFSRVRSGLHQRVG
jgi:hypothetical protein